MAPVGGGDERVLSYHDEILHASDLDILRGPNYINDRLISFYFTHLSLSLPSSILFTPPALSFLISVSPDAAAILAPLDLPSKSLILFPVNDNPDPAVAEGGNHWSLLIYHRARNEFVHHDSLRGFNRRCAQGLGRAVRVLVGGDGERSKFVEAKTPQQKNGYDCGMFVMAVAEAVCRWWERKGGGGEERWVEAVEAEVDAEKVERMRGEVLELITGLMTKK